jgi:hypothetical protein
MAKMPHVSKKTRQAVYDRIWAERAAELGEPVTEADRETFGRYVRILTDSAIMRAKLARMSDKPLEAREDHPI